MDYIEVTMDNRQGKCAACGRLVGPRDCEGLEIGDGVFMCAACIRQAYQVFSAEVNAASLQGKKARCCPRHQR